MSNYINVLRRLERERQTPAATPTAAPTPTPVPTPAPKPLATPVERTVIPLPSAPAPSMPAPAAPAPPMTAASVPTPAVATATTPAPSAPPLPRAGVERAPEPATDRLRTRAFTTAAHPGIATLLDAIRLIANGRQTRVVVFCGASNAEAVTTLADDLVAYASRNGMPAFLATLARTATGTAVVPARSASMDGVLAVDLDAGPAAEAIAHWAAEVGPESDLVVITGPPLAESIDAALLARACDGLIIVAESEVTERAALHLAAERARIAGCKTLGIVMHGSKDRLPGWMRRLSS